MFPEIVRDEVFRLETRRLWLRWPTMADAFDVKDAVLDAAGAGVRLPGMACIAAWRAAMERGDALHLMLEDKGARRAIGSVHVTFASPRRGVLDFQLAPGRRGEGVMTEAVMAVVHMVFLLDAAASITVSPLAGDTHGCGVLERSGFAPIGPSVRGTAAYDQFRIDRRSSITQDGRTDGPRGAAWRAASPSAYAPIGL